jgi:hypothetical protein
VNGGDRVLHSHGYLPWQITPSTVSNKPYDLITSDSDNSRTN